MSGKHVLFSFYLICIFATIGCERKEGVTDVFIQVEESINFDNRIACEVIVLGDQQDGLAKASIKAIGGFSRNFPKISYALSLSDPISFSDLPPDKDWILNASYIDKTFMRHRLSFDLFKMMNVDNLAPQSSYIRLHINDEPVGIYVLMQRVDVSVTEIDVDDPSALLSIESPIFKEDLFRGDSLAFNLGIAYPRDSKAVAETQLTFFHKLLLSAPDSVIINDIDKWIDIPNILDWHILLLFTNNSDGILKNFGLYKKDSLTPFKIAIWDYDHSFGRDGDNEMNMLKRNVDVKRSLLIKRLLETKELNYSGKLTMRYHQLRDEGVLSTKNIYRMMERYHHEIEDDIEANMLLWPEDGKWYYDHNSYSEEVALMKKFVPLNIARLDSIFNK